MAESDDKPAEWPTPPDLGKSVEKAIKFAATYGVPKDFIQSLMAKHPGINVVETAEGPPLHIWWPNTNWSPFLPYHKKAAPKLDIDKATLEAEVQLDLLVHTGTLKTLAALEAEKQHPGLGEILQIDTEANVHAPPCKVPHCTLPALTAAGECVMHESETHYIDTPVKVGDTLPPKKLAAKPPKPKKPEALNRRKVQDAMAEALLGVLPAVGMEDTPEHRRRVCRGLVHLGMSFMLDGGKDNPATVKKALWEAFKNEMEERGMEDPGEVEAD